MKVFSLDKYCAVIKVVNNLYFRMTTCWYQVTIVYLKKFLVLIDTGFLHFRIKSMFLVLIYFFTLELSQCPGVPWGCWWQGTACPDTCSRRGWADADSIPRWHRPPNEEQQELYRLNLDQVI